MAQNLFTDFPERVEQLKKYCELAQLSAPLEEAFGEKNFFKSPSEAMDFYHGVLEELGKLAAAVIRPQAHTVDITGAELKNGEVFLPKELEDNILKLKELGVFSGVASRAHQGFNLPEAVQSMALEILAHACPNTALTVACYAMVPFVETWGTEEQKQRIIPKLISLEWKSSMALTEPNAGSDLGQLRTFARREGDQYVINGSKIFITGGSGDMTFALVRTAPESKGLDGLSVLIVPRKIDGKDNYRVTKIEEKICLHASPTCEIVFENSLGELLGPEGEGFKVMLDLMNDARLAMAALATGIAAASLEEAKNYASQRVTMGKPIRQHPMIADMLYEMELEITAMRALVNEASMAFDWMRIAQKKGDNTLFLKWRKRYRRLTPLCKYYCCEKAITISRNALQIFGGYGVCKDYPVERLLRETIIYPIYEGTSQIQSLMVLKDTLKDVALQAPGFLGSLAGAWAESKVALDPIKSNLLKARNELNLAIKSILMSIIKDKFKSDINSLKNSNIQQFLKEYSVNLLSTKTDLTYPFLVAERFARITCDYYALKCLSDRLPAGDKLRRDLTLDFAQLVLPRMKLENEYMIRKSQSTLNYMKRHTS
ncbi:MAG: acyl-CoA dehydrogenase [Deltaproteobacteria bacterium]|nr:acyl-CoA dehydrogenase [Deltaproteobacteria bacterium]